MGVLSIDPSSPFTHGALLGDRIRLGEHFLDPGVFIRSMANRGALGGLSEAALQAALLLDAAGRQDVFVETVGVGQAEIDIIDHADTIVLVLMPGSGDSIQALKAGVMEIPDVIVINKADHPLTDTMVREIRGVLSLANLDRDNAAAARWRVPIVKTEAAHGRGIEELVERLEEHRAHILAAGQLAERRRRNLRGEVLALASARMRRSLEARLQRDESSSACWRRSWSVVWTRRARRRRCWSGPAWARKIWLRPTPPEIRAGKLAASGNVGVILFERFLSSLHLGMVWCNVLEASRAVVGGTTGRRDVSGETESCQ